jgi:hypothetical protein
MIDQSVGSVRASINFGNLAFSLRVMARRSRATVSTFDHDCATGSKRNLTQRR